LLGQLREFGSSHSSQLIGLFIALTDPVRYSHSFHLRADDLMACLLEYWLGLASSANFPGRTMLEYLEVIYKDVVWDLNDHTRYYHSKHTCAVYFEPYCVQNLQSKEFKALMSNMVSDIDVGNPNPAL